MFKEQLKAQKHFFKDYRLAKKWDKKGTGVGKDCVTAIGFNTAMAV